MATDSLDQARSRYVVGLDLGTTNSALAYVDTLNDPSRIQTFAVRQIVAPGQVEARESLPSFHYQAAAGEFPPGSLKLPWQSREEPYLVGQYARDQGTLSPARLINSAKSWLSHSGVDRTADLLPWQGAPDVDRLSPVAVSARYLLHYAQAWDAAFPDSPLAEQDFILTLPASFDEVARELTVRAAQQAGLKRVVLIEEPQAAFYAWIDKHKDNWEQLVASGQKILVCDIGGGTTDFTLIRVRKGADGLVQFHRVAVGEHLILGGDNFDLALAHHLERKLKGDDRLESRIWSVLVRSSRQLKETLLGPNPPVQQVLTLPGAGSRLIGGGLQVPVTRDEVSQVVLDGFFPRVELDAMPDKARSGFQEFGLPYAPDPAITKYLATFLSTHRHAGDDGSETTDHDPARPDLLLFNGGVFESSAIRERLIDQLHAWFRSHDPNWSITVLDNERLDLAVARGAAYYGMVRRGQGVRIAAGLARSYYIGVEGATGQGLQAICLCPAGLEPGEEIDLTSHAFELRLAEPIELPLYVSSVRLTDRPGALIAVDRGELTPLPPIRTVFKAGKTSDPGRVAVIVKARLTEIGTLDLWCVERDGKRSWKLLFDIRSATRTDVAATASTGHQQGVFDEALRAAAEQVIAATFQRSGADPATLMKRLSEALELPRLEWPMPLLRALWDVLLEHGEGRRLNAASEARWLNLTGFALRPGYGFAMDDWRVAETWKRLQGKLAHATSNVRVEWWVLWRRIAGGLTAGQQQSLATPLVSGLKEAARSTAKGRGGGISPQELVEQCRLLGSLEWLSPAMKQQMGQILFDLLQTSSHDNLKSAALWAIGRLGSRQPVYGPLNTVVSPDVAANWIGRVLRLRGHDPVESLTLMQLARKTGDRYRDVDASARDQVLAELKRAEGPEHYYHLVAEGGVLESSEQEQIFGDALPQGLRLL